MNWETIGIDDFSPAAAKLEIWSVHLDGPIKTAPEELAERRMTDELSFAASCPLFRNPVDVSLFFCGAPSVRRVLKSAFGIPVRTDIDAQFADECDLTLRFSPFGASPDDVLKAAEFVHGFREGERRGVAFRRGDREFSVQLKRTPSFPAIRLRDVFPDFSRADAEAVMEGLYEIDKAFGR